MMASQVSNSNLVMCVFAKYSDYCSYCIIAFLTNWRDCKASQGLLYLGIL